MATNDGVTNRSADDETLCADADPQNILELLTELAVDICARSLFLLIIFSILMIRSARGITWMIQKRLDKLREILY